MSDELEVRVGRIENVFFELVHNRIDGESIKVGELKEVLIKEGVMSSE